MSSKYSRNVIMLPLITLVVAASATGLALAYPGAKSLAKAEATRLTDEAGAGGTPQTRSFLELAARLDPQSAKANLGLAREQIASGEADAALASLNRAGQGSEASELRVRILLELDRNSEAADQAAALIGPGHTEAGVVLTALAFAQADRSSDIPALTALVSSPEAAQRLARVQAGQIPLAQELSVSGLPISTRRFLVKLSSSFERNVMLAKSYLARDEKGDLTTAADLAREAVALNPSDRTGHELLSRIYSEQNLPDKSAEQSKLAAKLQSGRP